MATQHSNAYVLGHLDSTLTADAWVRPEMTSGLLRVEQFSDLLKLSLLMFGETVVLDAPFLNNFALRRLYLKHGAQVLDTVGAGVRIVARSTWNSFEELGDDLVSSSAYGVPTDNDTVREFIEWGRVLDRFDLGRRVVERPVRHELEVIWPMIFSPENLEALGMLACADGLWRTLADHPDLAVMKTRSACFELADAIGGTRGDDLRWLSTIAMHYATADAMGAGVNLPRLPDRLSPLVQWIPTTAAERTSASVMSAPEVARFEVSGELSMLEFRTIAHLRTTDEFSDLQSDLRSVSTMPIDDPGAYVGPVMSAYLARIEAELGSTMQPRRVGQRRGRLDATSRVLKISGAATAPTGVALGALDWLGVGHTSPALGVVIGGVGMILTGRRTAAKAEAIRRDARYLARTAARAATSDSWRTRQRGAR